MFKGILQDKKNSSPLIPLRKNYFTHLVYHDYDLYNNIPIKCITEKDVPDKFEFKFLIHNHTVYKLYKLFFEKYSNMVKEDFHNLYDFIRFLLFHPNHFQSIFNSQNFSNDEIDRFISFKDCLPLEEREKFESFFNLYQEQERNKWLKIHNDLAKNQDKKEQILSKYGLLDEEAFKMVLYNRFISIGVKQFILENMNINVIKIIDVIDLINEMLERKLTIQQILNERKISKKTFDTIYKKLAEKNPLIYDYIRGSLSKNQRRGFYKLIRLGYAILNRNFKTYKDFQNKFSTISIDQLINNLRETELYHPLCSLINSWPDYQVEDFSHSNNLKKII